jgi:hypothetical protein
MLQRKLVYSSLYLRAGCVEQRARLGSCSFEPPDAAETHLGLPRHQLCHAVICMHCYVWSSCRVMGRVHRNCRETWHGYVAERMPLQPQHQVSEWLPIRHMCKAIERYRVMIFIGYSLSIYSGSLASQQRSFNPCSQQPYSRPGNEAKNASMHYHVRFVSNVRAA